MWGVRVLDRFLEKSKPRVVVRFLVKSNPRPRVWWPNPFQLIFFFSSFLLAYTVLYACCPDSVRGYSLVLKKTTPPPRAHQVRGDVLDLEQLGVPDRHPAAAVHPAADPEAARR